MTNAEYHTFFTRKGRWRARAQCTVLGEQLTVYSASWDTEESAAANARAKLRALEAQILDAPGRRE